MAFVSDVAAVSTASSDPGITCACMSTSMGCLIVDRSDAGHGRAAVRADTSVDRAPVGERLDRGFGVGQRVRLQVWRDRTVITLDATVGDWTNAQNRFREP